MEYRIEVLYFGNSSKCIEESALVVGTTYNGQLHLICTVGRSGFGASDRRFFAEGGKLVIEIGVWLEPLYVNFYRVIAVGIGGKFTLLDDMLHFLVTGNRPTALDFAFKFRCYPGPDNNSLGGGIAGSNGMVKRRLFDVPELSSAVIENGRFRLLLACTQKQEQCG